MERICSAWCISLALLKLCAPTTAKGNVNLEALEFNMKEPGLWSHEIALHIHFEN